MMQILVLLVTLLALTQQRPLAEIADDLKKLAAELVGVTPEPKPDPTAITVPAGGNVQAALDAVPVGGTVRLLPGVNYPGGLKVRRAVTLETADAGLLPGARVTEADRPKLARITTSANVPAIDITSCNVNVRQLAASGSVNDLVLVGHGDSSQTTAAQQPCNVVLDQLLIEGDPVTGAKRAVGLHGKNVTLKNSYIHQIRWTTDSSVIGGWNGEGPFTIVNNFLSGGSENILFGGANPSIPALIPSDILIEGNTLTFPLAWKGVTARKNVIEFKAGKRITIRDNVLENSWKSGQVGWCFVVTASQYGGFESVTVEDLLFEKNIVRHCGGFANILGHGQNQATRPTQVSRRLTFRDNYFYDLDLSLGDHGGLMQLGNGPIDVVWERNTIQMNGNAFLRGIDSIPIPGFRFTGNLVNATAEGATPGLYYGTFLAGAARGAQLSTRMPGAVISGNAFVKAHSIFKANLPSNMWLAAPSEATYDAATGVATGTLAAYGRR